MAPKKKVRIHWVQQELPLFAPAGFDELIRQKNIRGLSVIFSTRMKATWRVVLQPRTRMRQLVVPATLADAPVDVKEALIQWALLPWKSRGQPGTAVRRAKAGFENHVRHYMRCAGIDSRKKRRVDPDVHAARTKGTKYDLADIFSHINAKFFKSSVRAAIRWGSYGSATSYQSSGEDTLGNPYNLITIAGAYDHPGVPRFALEAVVYHEMLHIVHPTYKQNRRRIVHGPAFRQSEKAFPAFNQWRDWEKRSFGSIVRSMKRKKAKNDRNPLLKMLSLRSLFQRELS